MHSGINERASQRVEKLLAEFKDVHVLARRDLAVYKQQFTMGWELPGLCCSSQFKFRLLISAGFPYDPPRVAVWPIPPVLSWPHLEENGLLCLLSEHDKHSIDVDIESDVIKLLESAVKLVTAGIAGGNAKDFEDEFLNYWVYWTKTKNAGLIYSLCCSEGPSRWVIARHGKNLLLIGDDEQAVLRWMKNRYGEDNITKIKLQRIPLLWLPRALQPNEYPSTVGALLAVTNKMGVDSQMVMQLVKDEDLQYKSVLLGFRGRTGAGFAGLRISTPSKPVKNGFRQMPPDKYLLARYKGVSVFGAMINRLDAPWIHGRDHNPQQTVLGGKSVIIFGVGSVGSSVAELLAKSGAGKLTLVDPELLSSENISRHVLGVTSIGTSKAVELSRVLAARYPHLEIVGHQKSITAYASETPAALLSADLIISTIGSWRTESWLNALAVTSVSFPPVLYGWAEAHAAAGHAAVFLSNKGCLRCLTDDVGNVKTPVTSWSEHGTLLPVPACGGQFQPYGAVELSHIHSLVADLALDVLLGRAAKSKHNVWVGHRKLLEGVNKGSWSQAWVSLHGDPGDGSFIKEIDTVSDPSCNQCGTKK